MMQRPVWCVASVERATHDRRVPGHLVCQQVDFLPLSQCEEIDQLLLVQGGHSFPNRRRGSERVRLAVVAGAGGGAPWSWPSVP